MILSNLAGQTTRGRKDLTDFQREAEEFEARKRERALKEQADAIAIENAKKQMEFGVSSNDPSAVREWGFYSKLSPAEQQQYLRMKRSDQIMNLGGEMAVRSPLGGIQESYQVTPKITETPEYKAQQTAAQETAKAQAGAQADLPKALEDARFMKETIGKLINEQGQLQPGVESIVGGWGGMQGRQAAVLPLSGTQRKYQPIVNQIKGQVFMNAYQGLKGGGQITEVEGIKAESALARLDQAQTEEDFAAALKDLMDVVNAGERRAMQKANPAQMSRDAILQRQNEAGINPYQRDDLRPKELTYNPQTGNLE